STPPPATPPSRLRSTSRRPPGKALARRALVIRRLGEIPGVRTVVPGGAFYVFPDVSVVFGRRGPDGVVGSAHDLATYLLRHANVATVPGEGFGAPRPIRLSYAAPP